jgi:hypothetical protein
MAFLWPFRYHFLGGEEEDTYYMAAGEESFSPQNKQSALGIFLEPNDSANIVLYRAPARDVTPDKETSARILNHFIKLIVNTP